MADGPQPQELSARIGYVVADLNPRLGQLGELGTDGPFALDYNYRSVGGDLGRRMRLHAVELVSDEGPHRLNGRDLSVYTSDDNKHWQRHAEADFVDLGATIWLYGIDACAQYVKVHCHRDGTASDATFGIGDLQSALRVYELPRGTFVAGSGAWKYRTMIQVANSSGNTVRDKAVYLSFDELNVDRMIGEGQLQPDMSDLRFAGASGRELHAYSDGSGFFVRIPRVAPHSRTTIFAYSGNAQAKGRLDDSGALQVEYGYRTYVDQAGKSSAGLTFGSELHPVRLPDGTLMLVASTTSTGGLHARYSSDGGHTWSLPEPLIAPSDSTAGTDRAGGFLVDPTNGVITTILYSVGHSSGADWTDPSQHLCQVWVAQAHHYSGGKPVFGAPRPITLMNPETGRPVAWDITYTNPIRTRTGAYVVSVPYIFTAEGTFALAVIRSTDGGSTWQQSATPLTIPDPSAGLEGGVSESAITELDSGELYVIARQESTDRYYFGESWSKDDGVTWTSMASSTVLASNTSPSFNRGRGELLLAWSGHNALGQRSYWRNNLTIGYSDDDAVSYRGYHDMTGATSLSAPGWFNGTEQTRMLESFIVRAGSSDLLIGWPRALAGDGGASLLVEDIDRYLHDSQGALDVIRYRHDAGAADGSEFAQSRWWRSTPNGSLQLSTGVRAGSSALQLATSTAGTTAGASRLFPGFRTGRVRFRLKWSDLSSGLDIALQEGFSTDLLANAGANSRGAVAILRLDNAGAVSTTTDDAFDAVPMGGYTEDDTDPATGNLILGTTGGVAFDYNKRSIGLDLIVDREVDGLILVGTSFFTHKDTTRLEPGDLAIWTSDTNNGDWVEANGWSGTKDGLTITMTGPAVTTRYIKVTQPYTDHSFTFANYQQLLMSALPAMPDIEHPQKYHSLDVPTTLTSDDWHTVQLDVSLDQKSVDISVDGTVRTQSTTIHPARIVTHLLLLSHTGGATKVAIDELMVQDTSLGLLGVTQVGGTTQVGG